MRSTSLYNSVTIQFICLSYCFLYLIHPVVNDIQFYLCYNCFFSGLYFARYYFQLCFPHWLHFIMDGSMYSCCVVFLTYWFCLRIVRERNVWWWTFYNYSCFGTVQNMVIMVFLSVFTLCSGIKKKTEWWCSLECWICVKIVYENCSLLVFPLVMI